jgi:PKD repeat protein
MDYYGLAMAKDTFNNFLYIGGGCFNVYDVHGNPIPTDGVGLWDGFEWHPIGDGSMPQAISEDALAVYRGDLYVGSLDLAWGCLKRWDGVKWDSCQGGVNNTIYSLEVYKDSLYVAGAFSTVNHDSVPQGLATWFMPDTGCRYVKPMVHTLADTFKINSGQPTVNVQFYNNNAYVDTWAWDFGDMGTAGTQNPTHTYTAAGTYNVICTVSHNACVKTASKTIVVIDNTGIEDLSKEKLNFKLYPNPTSSDITVECTLPQNKTGELKTHHMNGSTRNSWPLQSGENRITIPSTGLATGVSLVSVFVDGGFVFTEKVVKQ